MATKPLMVPSQPDFETAHFEDQTYHFHFRPANLDLQLHFFGAGVCGIYTQLSRCGDTAFDRFLRNNLPGGGEKSLAFDVAFCAGIAFTFGAEPGNVDDELDGCDSVGVAFMPTFLPRLPSRS